MRKVYKILLGVIIVTAGTLFVFYYTSENGKDYIEVQEEPEVKKEEVKPPEIVFVGPRENIPEDAPADYGFWSFAIPVPGVLSRSGQPLVSEFIWLKENGWKSDVDFRVEGERGELGNDSKMPGFEEIGLKFKKIPIADGSPPTQKQAEEFLEFVTDKENQPVHIHCRGGYGRAGTMTALYRYAVQGWPIDKAIEESRLFKGGVSTGQTKWLEEWARQNEPGSYNK